MATIDSHFDVFTGFHKSAVLSKIWSLATRGDKSSKRSDFRDVNISDVVRMLLSRSEYFSLRIGGPMMVGLCRIYSKNIEHLFSRAGASLAQLESASKPPDQRAPPSTARKRSSSHFAARLTGPAIETPLHAIPEGEPLAFLNDVLFEASSTTHPMQMPPLSRTPVSASRKRVTPATPRSSVDEDAVFGVATPGSLEKRQRRISSLTEVMDSLRADDGQRRLSGLLGTTGNGSAFRADENDFGDYEGEEFDTGIDPPQSPQSPQRFAPIPSFAPSPISVRILRSRKQVSIRSLLDRKGKLEIAPCVVSEEMEKVLQYFSTHQFYLANRHPNLLVFPRADFGAARTSNVAWYVKRRVRVKPDDEVEDFQDHPDLDFANDCPTEPKLEEPPMPSSVFERVKVAGGSPLSVVASCSASSRLGVVRNFLDLLQLSSEGKLRLEDPSGVRTGFASAPHILVGF